MLLRCTILIGLLGIGCGGGVTGVGDDGPLGGSLTVTGDVVDFQTAAAVDGAISVTTSGLIPAPQVTTLAATFTITGIPENSAFQILAAAPPTHRATFSPAVVITNQNVDGVKAPVTSETYLSSLTATFGVTPTAAKGILFVRLVDAAGAPRAGVPDSELVLAGGAVGPFFLDANLAPAKNANTSSASGYAVFFEVAPGVVSLGQAANATLTIEMALSPVVAGNVTLADGVVSDGAPALPTNVSFAQQIVPIFESRGCVACHSGNGPGKDLGGLQLSGGTEKIFSELVTERPMVRVNLTTPEASLVLTRPSREDPPDVHPNVTFASPQDPDYLKLLVWILEGAKNN